jgi:cytochrome c-type biogenesis protein CcmF
MLAETGTLALILALLVCVLQSVLPLIGAARGNRNLMNFANTCAITGFCLVSYSFAILTFSFVTSDFSVELVAANSQLAKPLIYKFTGVWANHEGSMLLWVLILTLFAFAIAVFGRDLPRTLKARVLAVQGMIASAFLAFLIFTSNPFARLAFPPADGNGMNPLLQDPGLAVHPPTLYIGYVGFSVAFAFAVAALIEGRVDAAWSRWVRPWVLAAWCFLTMGITLGSFWAYYVLGWGGWWFWDPVENVSFMPWLAGTALLHSAIVVERRQTLISWTLLLAILTFSLSLIGTFVVRSGVLTSVHAFALDPARGVFILAILGAATGGALALYALRIPSVRGGGRFSLVSREASLILNNVFLVVAAAVVFFGTFYPLAIDLVGRDKITVGAPYYNITFVPIFLVLLVFMVVGPLLKWKRDDAAPVLKKLRLPLMAAVVLGLGLTFLGAGRIMTGVGLVLSLWVIFGTFWAFADRLKLGRGSAGSSLALLRTMPRAVIGLFVGHLGLGLVVMAITCVMTWQQENITALGEGESASVGGYQILLANVAQRPGPNYEAEQGRFQVSYGGQSLGEYVAERRFYPVQGSQTTQTSIRTNLISNLYMALGERNGVGKWTVRLYYHPFAPWIWIGGFTMALGGFLSLSDRRFRIGVAQKYRAAPGIAVAAE